MAAWISVPALVHLADVRTVVLRVGEVRRMSLDRLWPVISCHDEIETSSVSAETGPAGAAKQICCSEAHFALLGHSLCPQG